MHFVSVNLSICPACETMFACKCSFDATRSAATCASRDELSPYETKALLRWFKKPPCVVGGLYPPPAPLPPPLRLKYSRLMWSRTVACVAVAVLLTLAAGQACTPAAPSRQCSVTRFAGSPSSTTLDGVTRLAAGLSRPLGALVSTPLDALIVADNRNNVIRSVFFTTGELSLSLHPCTCSQY